MDTYLPIQEAANFANMTIDELYNLISSGKIGASMLATTGTLIVKRSELPVRREDTAEWAQVAHLQGVGIGIRQASVKYNIGAATLGRWVDRGLVHRLSGEVLRGQRLLVDEADVAYYAILYHRDPGQGKKTLQKR